MLGLAMSLPLLFCAVLARGQETDPAQVLSREYGLSRLGKGEVWITRREKEVRQRLDDLRPLVNRARGASEAIAKAQASNAALWNQRQALEQTIRKNSTQTSVNESQRKQLEEELKKLDAIAVAPEKLGGAPWMQPQLKDITNTFNSVLLGVFATRRDIERIDGEYADLAQQEPVRAALAQLGRNVRLGPLRDYRSAAPALEEYEQVIASQPHPLYLESGYLRVGAILNDNTPVTFSWKEGSDPAILTASMAQLAGIEPEPNAAERIVACPDGRRLAARRVVLSSLRFGKHVLHDVEAFVLPPEGEDCGAQIGESAFYGYRAIAEPAQLRLKIESR